MVVKVEYIFVKEVLIKGCYMVKVVFSFYLVFLRLEL